jgi:hypothetical protein
VCSKLDKLGIPQSLARELLLTRADLHWSRDIPSPLPFAKLLINPEERRVRGSDWEADYSRSEIARHWASLERVLANKHYEPHLKPYYRLMSRALAHATTPPTPASTATPAPATSAPAAPSGNAVGFLQRLLKL